ncbi:uncharacterized protein LOC118801246 [Colossoma macropomum]|uniref:uncharacterized protein LOC118801246 n=1 Tax=Colossoma macropomum TaxID=42526 RepID=UPI001863CA6F|nr:uncharacterized protein LOC118801246 [Colossoma macropomum]
MVKAAPIRPLFRFTILWTNSWEIDPLLTRMKTVLMLGLLTMDTLENVNKDSSPEEYADQITSDNSDNATAAQESTFASGTSSSVQSDDGSEQTNGASRKRPGTRVSSRYDKAMCTWSTEQQSFLEKMQEVQNVWMEKQLERSQQGEERLLAKLVEETSRLNERLVGQLLSGLSSIFSQTMSMPPFTQGGTAQFQYSHLQPCHPYPDSQNVHRSQNTPFYSDTDSYTFINSTHYLN